jgi:hypothetical protein
VAKAHDAAGQDLRIVSRHLAEDLHQTARLGLPFGGVTPSRKASTVCGSTLVFWVLAM